MPQLDVMFRKRLKSIAVCYGMKFFLEYDNVKH